MSKRKNSVCCEICEGYRTHDITVPCCLRSACRACIQQHATTHYEQGANKVPCLFCDQELSYAFMVSSLGMTVIKRLVAVRVQVHEKEVCRKVILVEEHRRRMELLHKTKSEFREEQRVCMERMAVLSRCQETIDRHLKMIEGDVMCRTHVPANYREQLENSPHMNLSQEISRLQLQLCSAPECRGIVSGRRCNRCGKNICGTCEQVTEDGHVCDEGITASVALLRRDSKPCPVCGSLIHRHTGCKHVHCTECHVEFDWETMVAKKKKDAPSSAALITSSAPTKTVDRMNKRLQRTLSYNFDEIVEKLDIAYMQHLSAQELRGVKRTRSDTDAVTEKYMHNLQNEYLLNERYKMELQLWDKFLECIGQSSRNRDALNNVVNEFKNFNVVFHTNVPILSAEDVNEIVAT